MAILTDKDGKPLVFVLNDDSVVDAHGERVLTQGINIEKRFSTNAPALWNHDRWSGLIGKWVNPQKRGSQLIANLDIAENNPLADWVGGQILGGYLKGCSLGYREDLYSQDPVLQLEGQERETVIYCVAYEGSVVVIPSNPRALVEEFESYIVEKKPAVGFQTKSAPGLKYTLFEIKTKSVTEDEERGVNENENSNHIPMNEIQFYIQAFDLELDPAKATLENVQTAVLAKTGKTLDELKPQIASLLSLSNTQDNTQNDTTQDQAQVVPPVLPQMSAPTVNEVDILLQLGQAKGLINAGNHEQYREVMSTRNGFDFVNMQIKTAPQQSPAQPQAQIQTQASKDFDLAKYLSINSNHGKDASLGEQDKDYDFHLFTKNDPEKFKKMYELRTADAERIIKTEFGIKNLDMFDLLLKFAPDEPLSRIFTRDIKRNLFPNNSFFGPGKCIKDGEGDISETQSGTKVVRANSGPVPGVREITDFDDPAQYPIPVGKRRKNKKIEYDVRQFATDRIPFVYSEELVFHYNAREELLKDHINQIQTFFANIIIQAWSPTDSAYIVRTSGNNKSADGPGATGDRKRIAKVDITRALTILKNNVQTEGEKYPPFYALFPTSFTEDMLDINDFIDVNTLGDEMLRKMGVTHKILSLKVMERTVSPLYNNAATPAAQNPATPNLAEGNLAGLLWTPDAVAYLMENLEVFMDRDGGYLGWIMNVALRGGADKTRLDGKGVVAIVQAHG